LTAYEQVATDPGTTEDVNYLRCTLPASLRRVGELYEGRGDRARRASTMAASWTSGGTLTLDSSRSCATFERGWRGSPASTEADTHPTAVNGSRTARRVRPRGVRQVAHGASDVAKRQTTRQSFCPIRSARMS